ncbi:hypothetical protein F4604DRAFT_1944586 [Suillus subluteus]|nr:hypothetical protein F4604DRAFT_1944586 [Suillus subluteus]
MTETLNPVPPHGAGGKSTNAFISANSHALTDEISDDESFLDEPTPEPFTPLPKPFPGNKVSQAFNFLNTLTPNTAKRVVGALTGADTSSNVMVPTSTSTDTLVFKDSDTIITKMADTRTEIPRPILNLVKAKISSE